MEVNGEVDPPVADLTARIAGGSPFSREVFAYFAVLNDVLLDITDGEV